MNKFYSLGVLGACLCLFACGKDEGTAQVVEESSPQAVEIVGEEVTYEANGTVLKGYIAYDASAGPRPGVLVVHEWWGHNDYVRDRARMLAEMGYTAFALDMYGDGKVANHPEDAQKFMMEVLANLDAAEARFRAAKSVLQKHPSTDPDDIAAIGYCFGGAVVLHMARSGEDLDAVASFHGSLGTQSPAQPGMIKARLLVANGADDPFVPAEEVEAFKAEMDAAGADMKFISYPGVVHSFTRPGATEIGEQFDMPLRYDEAADKDSWSELTLLLSESFDN
ncbi:MAG: dienelactone hydrolase family protein [Woeseiaceae bacterium]